MRLGAFLTFLTFVTHSVCLPALSFGRERLGHQPWRATIADLKMTGSETEVMMGLRWRLPNRRGHELLDFEHGGISYTVGIGRSENGRLAEIFLNTRKHGTAIDVNARDAAVAASLLLQHGCPLDVASRPNPQ
jgi:ribonucleoside-diphosphate reductase alpha chain